MSAHVPLVDRPRDPFVMVALSLSFAGCLTFWGLVGWGISAAAGWL